MNDRPHISAEPSHYDEEAEDYDILNEENSLLINQALDDILKKYKVKTVLDLTCGTGSQVFWLKKRGYEVTGSDINAKMLKTARDKARKEGVDVKLLEGDMRTLKVGKFDAVITIFNAVGHLTKYDFERAMKNIHENLDEGGLYVFDIFNLAYLLHEDNITKLTIDWQESDGDKRVRKIQYSTIDRDGILASYTTSLEQLGNGKLKIAKSMQTLQVYSAQQLKDMLQKNGFKIIGQSGADGSQFIETDTDRIVTIAEKQKVYNPPI